MLIPTDNIIIGNGLIARSFTAVKLKENIIVLALGVSNSHETRETEYLREKNVILKAIERHSSATIVYFSTCSLVNGANSRYTQHKLEMERLISDGASSFHIFRLPQVVGLVNNDTLVSFLTNLIIEGKHLTLQRAARRNLIDVADVARIACLLSNEGKGLNSIQNIAPEFGVPVLDIATEIAKIRGRNFVYNCIDAGDDQAVNIDFLKASLPSDDLIFSADYWRFVLRKYVPMFISSVNRESA
jgi:nucleoside-diphosphate-sugar epimerase